MAEAILASTLNGVVYLELSEADLQELRIIANYGEEEEDDRSE